MFNFLEVNPIAALFSAPFDVYFDLEQSVVHPDLFVVLKANEEIIKKNGVHGIPAIIIEIVSTNRAYDTRRKRALYEKVGVKEYFMIDPENKRTTLLTLNASGVYEQTYEDTGLFNSQILSCSIVF